MFQCQIELLMNILPNDKQSPDYMVVAKYNFEPPDLQIGNEVQVNWEVWDRMYHLRCKVVRRKSEICPQGFFTKNRDQDVFLLRVFVETEDREDKLQEIKDQLLKHNPHLRKH
jgi:hypothetical protein